MILVTRLDEIEGDLNIIGLAKDKKTAHQIVMQDLEKDMPGYRILSNRLSWSDEDWTYDIKPKTIVVKDKNEALLKFTLTRLTNDRLLNIEQF